jgi:endonuclease/exonuclease/phosphatase family metal-dependent hydrolase
MELTVASYNTHWGVDTHRHAPFDVVAPALELHADVLVVQESWRPRGTTPYIDCLASAMGAELHEAMFMLDTNPARPRKLNPPPGPPGTCGLAVLTRVPVLDVRTVDLPHALGDVVDRRQSLIVTVGEPGDAFTVAGIHASHRLWGSLPQIRMLDRELALGAEPSAIVGDCNMWGPVVGAFVPSRRRAVIGRTWPAHRPHSQIDHVWIDERIEVLDAGVAGETGSDHRPIWARLRTR